MLGAPVGSLGSGLPAWGQRSCCHTTDSSRGKAERGDSASHRVNKTLMFSFLPGDWSPNTTNWSLWGLMLGTHLQGQSVPKQGLWAQFGRALSLSWHRAMAHGVAELHRQLWVTHFGKEVKGDVFLSKVLRWSEENKQNYGQEHKYMIWHLHVVLLLLPFFFFSDTLFIP